MTETSHDPAAIHDPPSLVLAAIAAQVIGGLITQMSPFVISGLMHGFSLSGRDAAFVGSAELLTLAATAIAIAPALPRLSCRSTGLAAVGLTLLADGASIFCASWISFVLLRALAGMGEGALYAMSLSVVACRSRSPDRVYGYFQIVWALGSAALFLIGGDLTAAFAYRGILALIAGVTAALTPLLLLVPDTPLRASDETLEGAAPASPLLGMSTFIAIVLYLTASAAIYMFTAPLGERAGLDTSSVGYALTVASLVGLAGAGAATAINVRWGRATPISGFCAGFSAVAVVLCLSHDATAYLVSLVASVAVFYFSIPYLFGLAAALDRSGRWAAAAGSAYLIGFAAGPMAGGAMLGLGGYPGIAALCVAMTLVVWGLTMFVHTRLKRTARASLAARALA